MRVGTCSALGRVVREERLRQNLTQAEVAASAGVSRPWLSRFEHGKQTVELNRVLAVVCALGLRMDIAPAPPDPLRVAMEQMLDDCARP